MNNEDKEKRMLNRKTHCGWVSRVMNKKENYAESKHHINFTLNQKKEDFIVGCVKCTYKHLYNLLSHLE